MSQGTGFSVRRGQMSFGECLKEAALNGGKFRRLAWDTMNTSYVHFMDGRLMLWRMEDGTNHPLLVSDGDVVHEDWVRISN